MVNNMNETIGTKGGHNDRLRTIRITKKQKRKLQENLRKKRQAKLRKLEKEVKQQTIKNFFIAVPISIIGNTFETLISQPKEYETERDEAKALQKEELHEAGKLELDEIINPLKEDPERKKPDVIENKEMNQKEVTITQPVHIEVKEENENQISIPTINEDKIKKLEDQKIVERYENNLKEIKQELKNIVYEYTILEKKEQNIKDKKEAEEILSQLTEIIKHLEILKQKLKTQLDNEDIEQEITALIDSYIERFKGKEEVEEINDSKLYIMLSSAIEEAKLKTQKLSGKVKEEKEELELNEEEFQLLQEEYYNFENFNNELLMLQYEGDYLEKDLEEKINNSITVTEQVTYQVEFLNKQSKKLLALLSIPMLIPGNRSAKAVATATAAYILLMKNLLNPKLKKKKYKTVSITDYSSQIESGIDQIDNALNLVSKSAKKLEEMMRDLDKKFSDEIKGSKEYQELYANLEKLLSELQEKEEELKRRRKEQEELLVKNNEKVKVYTREEEM